MQDTPGSAHSVAIGFKAFLSSLRDCKECLQTVALPCHARGPAASTCNAEGSRHVPITKCADTEHDACHACSMLICLSGQLLAQQAHALSLLECWLARQPVGNKYCYWHQLLSAPAHTHQVPVKASQIPAAALILNSRGSGKRSVMM